MKVVTRPGSGLFKTAKTLGPTVPMPLLGRDRQGDRTT
jgi:hypothetical protein